MAKRKSGQRDKGGRLKRSARAVAFDYGNDRVRQRRAVFAVFQGGKADNEIHDTPGQAWAAGLFEGYPADAIALRDAARDYGNLYWGYYVALLPKSPNMERSGKSTSTAMPEETARERRFAKMDEAMPESLANPIRRAVHELCVNYWGSDEISPWVQRMINSRLVLRGGTVAGRLADDADWNKLECAMQGLLAMVSGSERKCA